MEKPEFHDLDVEDQPVGTVEQLASAARKRDAYEPWCSETGIFPGSSLLFSGNATHIVRKGMVWRIKSKPSILKRWPVNQYCEEIVGRYTFGTIMSKLPRDQRLAWKVFCKGLDLKRQVEEMGQALAAAGCDRVWRCWRQRETLLIPDCVFAELAVIGIGGKRKLKE